MEDTWLQAFKREPSPEFARTLRSQLRQQERPGKGSRWSLRSVAIPATAAATIALLLWVPAVRASAAAFLARFRVTNFVAIPVDPRRLDALHAQQLDVERLIGDHVQVLRDPGPPVTVATTDEAAAAAGFDLRLPQWLPADSKIVQISVVGEHAAQVTADSARLQQVMDALGIDDLHPPAGLDGQTAMIRVPPIVMVRYDDGKRRTRLFQSLAPEITLPPGVELSSLGEIGLRILGLTPQDAHHFAGAIDWQSTLLVPVPPTAQSFREIDVAGNHGILIEHDPPNELHTSIVLWSTGDGRVFGIVSSQGRSQVMEMANSIR